MPVCHPSESAFEVGSTRFTPLAAPSSGSAEASVWQVELQPGDPGLPHSLTREEIIVVLNGLGEARLAGETEVVGPGAAIVIPAETEFSLAAIGSEPLRAIAFLPVGGQAVVYGGEPFTPPWAQ